MRRTVLVSVAVVVALVMASGTALAEEVACDPNPPCYGTPESDDITSTAISDQTIYALGGSDNAVAGEGEDTLYGAAGNDFVAGVAGDDTLYGGSDNDTVESGYGSDTGYGGSGNDTFYVSFGGEPAGTAGSTDYSYGGRGNDTFLADDGNVDIINCGKGKADTVYYDVGTDTIKNCEIKNPGQ